MADRDTDTLIDASAVPSDPQRTEATEATQATITASAVLHSEEVARARVFFKAMVGVCTMVVCAVPFLPGAPSMRVAVGGVAVIGGALCATVVIRTRNELFYTPRLVTFVGVGAAVVTNFILYYMGFFSSAPLVLAVGAYFFGLSESFSAALAAFATGAGLFGIGSALVAADVIPDPSLFKLTGVPQLTRWFTIVMSESVLVLTFFLARSSRRATEIAVERAYRVNLQLRQRDALLAEARGELDRALRPGEGRYTGENVGGYRLGDLVGKGAMGEVYRATHVARGTDAAVKLLHPNVLEDPTNVERFLREAEAASSVNSEHVAKVLEVGSTPSGAPFLVMELLAGRDLATLLRRSPRLPLSTVLDMVDQSARALAAVREAGIVHRDLKPQNLFLAEPSTWKVLDFGVSKTKGPGRTLTQGGVIGTPAYMPPEQARGEDVDHLGDLYALTAIAYRAITGKPAFTGNDVATVLYNVIHAQPSRPGELVKLPPDVEIVLAIGMAKRPGDRFAKVEELARALRLAAHGRLDDATRARGVRLMNEYPWGRHGRLPSRGAA